MGGAIPFLISWGEATHPASAVPHAGELLGLTIEHPDSNGVRQSVSVLDVDVAVVQADKFGLVARIETEVGIRILK
jgi:glycine cleavage system regulatory protein